MHTPLLRTLTLGLLITVLAACSGVDAPTTEEGEGTSLSETQIDTDASNKALEDGTLGTLQAPNFAGFEQDDNILSFDVMEGFPSNGVCFHDTPGVGVETDAICYISDNPVPVGFSSGFTKIRSSWNDRVSSVLVAPGYDIVMYTDANYGGRATVVGDDTAYRNASRIPNNNTLSSFKIIRTN